MELLDSEPGLNSVLMDAVEPLQKAFGDKPVLKARIQHADEDRLLKVAVQLPASFSADPEAALRSFDESWWIENCHRSSLIEFDYERSDALQTTKMRPSLT